MTCTWMGCEDEEVFETSYGMFDNTDTARLCPPHAVQMITEEAFDPEDFDVMDGTQDVDGMHPMDWLKAMTSD